MAELVESLKQSAVNRRAMVHRFGFVPRSLLNITRAGLSAKMFTYQRENITRGSVRVSEDHVDSARAKHNARLRKAAGVLGGTIALANHGGHSGRMQASTMPAELVEFFVKYYARPGDTYLDPFMGQGIQMQVAHLMGLHYRGYDCSEEFCRYIMAVRDRIAEGDGTAEMHPTQGDSRYPDEVPDGCGDFGFTSPPYWDIEYYGDEPEQLGAGTYPDFLAGMKQIAAAWLPKFKAGGYYVVNVNDFRKDGVFYPYHADTIALHRSAGWIYHDMWIIDGLVGGLPKAFAVNFNMKRIAPKTHEYALVFRRPKELP